MSCVSNVDSVSVLSYVLCVQCWQCLCIVLCLVCSMLTVSLYCPMSCVSNVDTQDIGWRTLSTLDTQDIGRRTLSTLDTQDIGQYSVQCWQCSSSYVLCVQCWQYFWIVLCLVYPMLPVFLDCQFLIAPLVLSNVYLQISGRVDIMVISFTTLLTMATLDANDTWQLNVRQNHRGNQKCTI
jgi:hypothetical protein